MSGGSGSAGDDAGRRPPVRPVVRQGGGVRVTVRVPGEPDPKKALEKIRGLTGAPR
ncbi:hypothetical protein O0235_06920 [Tepidiforma flava]|uniref:DUF167 domain-containing protein n=1 Tax=Tepidiforma flava TaxID=3004094 RepID=A0ABY7M9R6_9CHLR|nr:hypothetical protein [Tepidiforma flava]WBL37297.1 hypothetical protein O0235_06920 [Tepidiforma flava]